MSCSSCRQFGGSRKTTRKHKGGANGAPLSYLNPKYVEPSGPEGSNKLISEPLLARPALNHTGGKRSTRGKRSSSTKRSTRGKRSSSTRRGGFYPSVMGTFLSNGARLLPPSAVQGYRMLRNYKKSRKNNM
jgi:hypothetical protein